MEKSPETGGALSTGTSAKTEMLSKDDKDLKTPQVRHRCAVFQLITLLGDRTVQLVLLLAKLGQQRGKTPPSSAVTCVLTHFLRPRPDKERLRDRFSPEMRRCGSCTSISRCLRRKAVIFPLIAPASLPAILIKFYAARVVWQEDDGDDDDNDNCFSPFHQRLGSFLSAQRQI